MHKFKVGDRVEILDFVKLGLQDNRFTYVHTGKSGAAGTNDRMAELIGRVATITLKLSIETLYHIDLDDNRFVWGETILKYAPPNLDLVAWEGLMMNE